MVHSCPRCDLRFETAIELADHLETDHGVDLEPGEEPDPSPGSPL